MSKELPNARPACPARRLSRDCVPVEVVGRPSRGEGRTPGGKREGGGCVCIGFVFGESSSARGREVAPERKVEEDGEEEL